MKKNLGSVLFFGLNNCHYTNKVKNFLKTNSKKFYFVKSNRRYENIPKKILSKKYDYIFCFRSYYILKKNLLKKVRIASVNFHPGPPEYRGTGCVNYALYDNSKFYGCTAHIINEKIDNGEIINCKKFKINKNSSVESVLLKTYNQMVTQALYVIKKIIHNNNNLKKLIAKNSHIKWSNKIKKIKDLNNFYEIKKNCSKKEFLNKIRATDTSKFKPYILLYKKRFTLDN